MSEKSAISRHVSRALSSCVKCPAFGTSAWSTWSSRQTQAVQVVADLAALLPPRRYSSRVVIVAWLLASLWQRRPEGTFVPVESSVRAPPVA